MITNGRVQLWPFLRVALFLVVGVLIGDALDCRVPSSVWMWAYVALLSAFVASYFFCASIPFSDCCAFYYGGGRRLVAHHLFS